jgi:hypothetical protein
MSNAATGTASETGSRGEVTPRHDRAEEAGGEYGEAGGDRGESGLEYQNGLFQSESASPGLISWDRTMSMYDERIRHSIDVAALCAAYSTCVLSLSESHRISHGSARSLVLGERVLLSLELGGPRRAGLTRGLTGHSTRSILSSVQLLLRRERSHELE